MFSAYRIGSVFFAILNVIVPYVSPNPTLDGRGSIVSSIQAASKKYDFIVVGGGTAGLTVADRLTEDPRNSVLVVEHGYFYDANDPSDSPRPSRYYNITSLPATELGGKNISITVGHCVGGSSAVNGMGVVRATKPDYDIWAELGGPNSTWTWDGLLPYFRKAMHLEEPDPAYAKEWNITYDIPAAWGQYNSSRVKATFSTQFIELKKTLYNALKKVPGIKIPRDGSAGSLGLFYYPISMEPIAQNRSYSRTGHWDGLNRPNYDIVVGMKVVRVNFDGKQASGVRFVPKEGGQAVTVSARKEVILSAGALHTPQILLLSGIGPAKYLSGVGIQVKSDLPGVGQNLQDHPTGPNVSYVYGIPPPNKPGPPSDIWREQGMMATLNLPVVAPDRYASIAQKYSNQNLSEYLPESMLQPEVIAGQRAIQRIVAREMLGNEVAFLNYIVGGVGPWAIAIGSKIASRGTVTLNASNPEGEAVVDLRPLSNPIDVDLMIAHTRFFRTHFTRDLAEWNTTELRPGLNVTTDEQLEEVVRSEYNPVAGHHFLGTAAKMPKHLGGVVDEELFVHGVRGLRVADASIMPLLPGAATQFSVYSIGEKAAELIKAKWR